MWGFRARHPRVHPDPDAHTRTHTRTHTLTHTRAHTMPIFSRPITSPDFMRYISQPRRRRFVDKDIWPNEFEVFERLRHRLRFERVMLASHPSSMTRRRLAGHS